MFPILPALILFLLQAHSGGECAALPIALDAWRTHAITRGIDDDKVREVTGVILKQLRKEKPRLAPATPVLEESKPITPAPTANFSERNAEVQRSRDGPNGI